MTFNSGITSIGVTGGIGSGKSYVCRKIETKGFPVFYCDDEAKKIILSEQSVKVSLTKLIGTALYTEDGKLEKSVMAAYLCQGKENAKKINAIVHPAVQKAFLTWLGRQSSPLCFMECALLFEAGFDCLVQYTLLVSASEETRIQRVMKRDGIDRQTALKWINLQMSEEKKKQLVNYELKNDINKDFEIDTFLTMLKSQVCLHV